MRNVSRTHRVALDWLVDRINLVLKIQVKYTDTINQLAYILTKGNFYTWWVEPSFVFVQHKPFQLHQQRQSDVEKNPRRRKWRKSHSKIKADDEFGIEMPCKGSDRACLCCTRKPGENQIWKSNTSELVDWAADLWWALAHQATQNETLTKSGLLKNGNLMKCWKQERRDPWKGNSHPGTQTSLSLMTIIWTLTLPQNQTFR